MTFLTISYKKMKNIEKNEKIARKNTKLEKSKKLKKNIFFIISYKKMKK